MGKVKELGMLVKNLLIVMLTNDGVECPDNIYEISDFITDDIIKNNPDEFDTPYLGTTIMSSYKKWNNKSKKVINPEATEKVTKIIKNELYGTPIGEIKMLKGMSDVEVQRYCNQKFDKSKPLGYGDKISNVGELRKLMSDLDANDLVCVEGIDLQTGDVEDLYPMNLDVIEDIKLSNGSVVREVRFCQMMNSAPDTRNKQPVIDALIETFEPMTDTTVLEELLKTIPFEILLHSLPEEDWVKFRYNAEPEKYIWSQIGSNHEDDDKIFIDAWLTGDDDETGKVIAKIDIHTKEVIYFDERAKYNKYAQEVINERLKEL